MIEASRPKRRARPGRKKQGRYATMAKILIVDDEPRIRELIREHLQHAGFTCDEATDGGAALALLTGGGFDLVILDIMMPFMDGMTCLHEMRSR